MRYFGSDKVIKMFRACCVRVLDVYTVCSLHVCCVSFSLSLSLSLSLSALCATRCESCADRIHTGASCRVPWMPHAVHTQEWPGSQRLLACELLPSAWQSVLYGDTWNARDDVVERG